MNSQHHLLSTSIPPLAQRPSPFLPLTHRQPRPPPAPPTCTPPSPSSSSSSSSSSSPSPPNPPVPSTAPSTNSAPFSTPRPPHRPASRSPDSSPRARDVPPAPRRWSICRAAVGRWRARRWGCGCSRRRGQCGRRRAAGARVAVCGAADGLYRGCGAGGRGGGESGDEVCVFGTSGRVWGRCLVLVCFGTLPGVWSERCCASRGEAGTQCPWRALGPLPKLLERGGGRKGGGGEGEKKIVKSADFERHRLRGCSTHSRATSSRSVVRTRGRSPSRAR